MKWKVWIQEFENLKMKRLNANEGVKSACRIVDINMLYSELGFITLKRQHSWVRELFL